MAGDLLRTEEAYFEELKPQLLRSSEGKFALVVGRRLIGTFDSAAKAYEEGLSRFGNVPMFIAQVLREEARDQVPALTLGLIRARFP